MESYQILLLMTCRMIVALAFSSSLLGKLIDIPSFQLAITGFRVLPPQFTRSAAIILLVGEALVLALILAGGDFLPWGFALALFMLFTFTFVILSALIRRLKTPCNCFGRHPQAVSYFDVVRNTGFLICTAVGLAIAALFGEVGREDQPSALAFILSTCSAVGIFTLLRSLPRVSALLGTIKLDT